MRRTAASATSIVFFLAPLLAYGQSPGGLSAAVRAAGAVNPEVSAT